VRRRFGLEAVCTSSGHVAEEMEGGEGGLGGWFGDGVGILMLEFGQLERKGRVGRDTLG
jgi:hypothetical protein